MPEISDMIPDTRYPMFFSVDADGKFHITAQIGDDPAQLVDCTAALLTVIITAARD